MAEQELQWNACPAGAIPRREFLRAVGSTAVSAGLPVTSSAGPDAPAAEVIPMCRRRVVVQVAKGH
jgi:hypothetical protein